MSTSRGRPLSLLDFVDVPQGLTAQDAIRRSVRTAQAADRLGYSRYWISEHHSFAGLASSSPEILIAHLAGLTERIRVGAAGIMLPNHSPLKVAEWFRTLEMLHPRRIDLGLGRAPGTDQLTAFALRRSREALTADDFPQQAAELIAFLSDRWPADHPFRSVLATPLVDTSPELLMLGSSGWGSSFAAANGMTTVFAHHMSPGLAVDALRAYRRDFRPGPLGDTPRVIISVLALATDDDDVAADFRAGWALQRQRIGRGDTRRPSSAEIREFRLSEEFRRIEPTLAGRVYAGPPASVAAGLTALADEAGADEVTLVAPTPDLEARLRSLELLAAEFALPGR
ncbi:LLM class flavin-dependent oxidoreductase [Pedococcus sp. 5OH_020]|uniref:LLM class flavin-dependent oxidoreductase n=1 Tax=Pedococcus sp. 5OH_020 TaxID=2989814 RepID=UPI0022E9A1B0|nr:LLM class flavin-dependent oxidoreductase [Pedococcus sp. 5OH_020]